MAIITITNPFKRSSDSILVLVIVDIMKINSLFFFTRVDISRTIFFLTFYNAVRQTHETWLSIKKLIDYILKLLYHKASYQLFFVQLLLQLRPFVIQKLQWDNQCLLQNCCCQYILNLLLAVRFVS